MEFNCSPCKGSVVPVDCENDPISQLEKLHLDNQIEYTTSFFKSTMELEDMVKEENQNLANNEVVVVPAPTHDNAHSIFFNSRDFSDQPVATPKEIAQDKPSKSVVLKETPTPLAPLINIQPNYRSKPLFVKPSLPMSILVKQLQDQNPLIAQVALREILTKTERELQKLPQEAFKVICDLAKLPGNEATFSEAHECLVSLIEMRHKFVLQNSFAILKLLANGKTKYSNCYSVGVLLRKLTAREFESLKDYSG